MSPPTPWWSPAGWSPTGAWPTPWRRPASRCTWSVTPPLWVTSRVLSVAAIWWAGPSRAGWTPGAGGLSSTAMVLGGLLGVVAGILAVGGAAKLRDPEATVPMLRALGLPASPVLARVLGLVELGVGIAAFLVGGRILAAAVAVLFLGFTVAVLRLRAGGEAVSCGCFGRSSAPPTLIHAVADLVAAGVAVAAAVVDAPGFLSVR